MDRDGFTLVELIAVITILGLLALVVFPSVNASLKQSRADAYDTQKNQIIKAAREYFYENPSELPDAGSKDISVEILRDKGYISASDLKNGNIVDPRDTNKCLTGNVIVSVSESGNKYVYEYDDESGECNN